MRFWDLPGLLFLLVDIKPDGNISAAYVYSAILVIIGIHPYLPTGYSGPILFLPSILPC